MAGYDVYVYTFLNAVCQTIFVICHKCLQTFVLYNIKEQLGIQAIILNTSMYFALSSQAFLCNVSYLHF